MASEIGLTSTLQKRLSTFRTTAKAVDAQKVQAPSAPAPVATALPSPGFFPGVQTAPAAQAAPQPQAVQPFPVAFIPEEKPWFKKPLVLGAIGAGVLVLGAGGYMLTR